MSIRDRLPEMRVMMTEPWKEQEDDEPADEKPTPLIKFFEHARLVKIDLHELKSRVNNLKVKLYDNQYWICDEKRKETEHKIEEEKLIIGNTAKAIRNNLKSMKNAPLGAKGTTVVQRIKDVQLNNIKNELNDIIGDYLNCLVIHRDRSVKILKDMMKVKGDGTIDIDSLLEEGKIAIFTNNLLLSDMEEKYNLRETEEKHREIMKIESSILEMSNLFNELALMLDLQGEKVEAVRKIVDDNLVKVERGNKKLESARKKNKKIIRRKLIITVICCSVILVVLLLLLAF